MKTAILFILALLLAGCQSYQTLTFQQPARLALPAGAVLQVDAEQSSGIDAADARLAEDILFRQLQYKQAGSSAAAQFRLVPIRLAERREDAGNPALRQFNTSVTVIGRKGTTPQYFDYEYQELAVTDSPAGLASAQILFLKVYSMPENRPLGVLAFRLYDDRLPAAPADNAAVAASLHAQCAQGVQDAVQGPHVAAACFVPSEADATARTFLQRGQSANAAIRVRTLYPLPVEQYLLQPHSPAELKGALANYYVEALARETAALLPAERTALHTMYVSILTHTQDPALAQACAEGLKRLGAI